MFILPDENDTTSEDQYTEVMLARIHFNDVCSNAILQGCPADVVNEYAECTKIYGNITLDQCKEKCCDPNRIEREGSWLGLP